MNSRNKGKVGEREFAALLRENGFDARRGQQFSGSPDSPDIVSDALGWLHVEVKRVQTLNLAEACAQAKRDSCGKPWIVAHRKNRGPWFITMDSDALYKLLRQTLPFFDLWPFTGPRCVTLDAELFFQFLRVTLPVAAPLANAASPRTSPRTSQRNVPTEQILGESPERTGRMVVAPLATVPLSTEQTKQQEQK